MRSVLQEVVTLGGLALQREDCAIRAAVHSRGEHGGLVHIQNERHHQFTIWKATLPVWHVDLEKHDNTDLTIACEDGQHYFEMKNWTDETGLQQLPMIQKDIYKLQCRDLRYIIITSVSSVGKTDEDISFLQSKVVGLNENERHEFRFGTLGFKGEPLEFWIAGWPVLSIDLPVYPALEKI